MVGGGLLIEKESPDGRRRIVDGKEGPDGGRTVDGKRREMASF
jgi:hypothetical protein